MTRSGKTAAVIAALAGAGALWLATASAETPQDACVAACDAKEKTCLEACSDHVDPEECESACRDAAWQCRQEC